MVDKGFMGSANDASIRYFERKYDLMRMFVLKKNWIVDECGGMNPVFAARLFQQDTTDDGCGRVTFRDGQLTIELRPDPSSSYRVVGSARLDSGHTNSEPALSIYLPAEQKVFTTIPDEARMLGRLFGEHQITTRKWHGVLRIDLTGELLPLQIEAETTRASATVFKDGGFHNDAFFLE
jgi:hypothetical protein